MQKNRTTSAGLKRNVSDQQGYCLLTDELLPIFPSEKPSHVTDLFPIKCLVAKCSSSVFLVPLTFPNFYLPVPTFWDYVC